MCQMSPVVITLVSNGSRCLLARQPSFPPGMFTALSGFCDLGKWLLIQALGMQGQVGTSAKSLCTEEDGHTGGLGKPLSNLV